MDAGAELLVVGTLVQIKPSVLPKPEASRWNEIIVDVSRLLASPKPLSGPAKR